MLCPAKLCFRDEEEIKTDKQKPREFITTRSLSYRNAKGQFSKQKDKESDW